LPGGAVYINDHLLRSKGWRSMVSLAGPFMNLALIWIMCIPFWVGALEHPRAATLACGLAFLIQLEICAVLFNLIPCRPWMVSKPSPHGCRAHNHPNDRKFQRAPLGHYYHSMVRAHSEPRVLDRC